MLKSIAIDGPAGAGKSTIAKKIAGIKGIVYVDTGAMYRAMALYCMRNCLSADEPEKIEQSLDKIDITIEYENNEQIVKLNGENVNGLIRTQEVGDKASSISTVGSVRKKMVALQQNLAAVRPVIMDGRDIGTVVLPEARVKIFLTASVEKRAERRFKELTEKGIECDLKQIEKEIEERDYRDTHRENSPLKCADDAITVDTTDMSIDEVVEKILEIARDRGI